MSDVNIGAKLMVDTGTSAKSINDINKEIKAASAAMKEAKLGSEEYEAAQRRLSQAQQQLSSSTKEKVTTFAQLKEQLRGTVPALDNASSGVMGLGRQLVALMANPIVLFIAAIVGGLKFLYNAFTNTLPGAQKMEQIFAGLKTVITVITDRLTSFGNAIIKLFSGDFKGAAEATKAAFKGVGEEITDKFGKAQELTKTLQRIRGEEREDARDKANRLARLATLKEQLNDESISASEKKKIAAQLKKDSDDNAKDDLRRQKEKTAAEIALIEMKTNKTEEDLNKINELQIEIDKTERENKMEGVRINKVIRNLDKQGAAEAAAEKKKRDEDEKARLENIREYKNKIQKLQQEKELELTKEGYEREKKQLYNQQQENIRDTQKSLDEKKITIEQYNEIVFEETNIFYIKLKQLEDKHNKEIADAKRKAEEEKVAQLKRSQEFQKQLQDEEVKNQIKARTDYIKLIDSQLSLDKARHIATIQMERETFETKRALEKQNLIDSKASVDEITAFENETAAQRIANEKTVQDVKLKLYNDASDAIIQILGAQSVVGKGLALSQIGIDTALAISALTKNSEANPTNAVTFGAAGAIQFASGMVRVLANIAKAKQVLSGSGSLGGGSVSAPIVSAPLRPQSQVQRTLIDQEQVNQMGNAAVKAYVVESDVRNNAERIAQINRAARIG